MHSYLRLINVNNQLDLFIRKSVTMMDRSSSIFLLSLCLCILFSSQIDQSKKKMPTQERCFFISLLFISLNSKVNFDRIYFPSLIDEFFEHNLHLVVRVNSVISYYCLIQSNIVLLHQVYQIINRFCHV